MTPRLPIFALTVYDSDDSTPLWSVTTDPLGTNPYLKHFDNWPEQEVDFARGAASIGQMNVRIVDVRTDPTDQSTGWLTARLADAGGYSALNGHRVLATQDLGSGAEVVLEGVIKGVTLLDTYSTYELELRDIRERARKVKAFERTSTPTILPRGVLEGYGIAMSIPLFGGGTFRYPSPATRQTPLKAQYQSLGSGQGEIAFLGGEVGLTPAAREALLSVAPLDGSPEVFVYDRWKLLWRLTSAGGAYTEITRVAHTHASLLRRLPLFLESVLGIDTLYVNNVVDGGTLPGDLDEIDVIVQYDGPVTKDWPHHIEGMTLGELLAELYDGDHSINPTRLRYNSAAVLALNTPIRARILEPIEDLRDWEEKHAYPIAHAAPTLNADGEITPVTYLLPDASEVLPHLDDSNCGPDGAGWAHGSQDAINTIVTKYIREYRLRDKDSVGLAEGDRVKEYEQPVTVHDQASIDLLGEKKLEISGLLLRAIGTPDGGPLFGDYIDETGALVAARVGYALRDRLSRGGQYFRVRGMRTDSDVEALKAGSWVTCGFSWMPDYNSGERGLSRLGQVIGRRNIDAAWSVLTLIDAGSNNAPLTAPTLGVLTVDAAGVVSIPVTALGSGSEARVDFAVNATEPAADSSLWTFLGRVDSVPTTLKTPPVGQGVNVWARARGEGIGRRPSTYTVASSVAVGATARVTNVSVTVDDAGNASVSWLPNAVCLGVRVRYSIHAVGAAVGALTDVDLDASDLEYIIPTKVGEDYHVTVHVAPYPGWTGAAVSGTAGPTVEVRARGTVGEALLTGLQIGFTDTGQIVLSWSGNEWFAKGYVTIGLGSTPADPTSGSTHVLVGADGNFTPAGGTVAIAPPGVMVEVKVLPENTAGITGTVAGVFRRRRGDAQFIPPRVQADWSRVGASTAALDLTVSDPSLAVTALRFNKREGSEAGDTFTGFVGFWDRGTGTAGTDETITRGEDVLVEAGQESIIRWEVDFTDENGDTQTLAGAVSSTNVDEASTTLYIGAGQFAPTQGSLTDWSRANGYLTPTVTGQRTYLAHVIIPVGVTVTEYGFRLYRQSASDLASGSLTVMDDVGTVTQIGTTRTHAGTGWTTLSESVSRTAAAGEQHVFSAALRNNVVANDARLLYASITFTRHDHQENY